VEILYAAWGRRGSGRIAYPYLSFCIMGQSSLVAVLFLFFCSPLFFSFLFLLYFILVSFFCSNMKIVHISNFVQIWKKFRFQILNCSDFKFCSILKIVQISNFVQIWELFRFKKCSNLKIVLIWKLFRFLILFKFQVCSNSKSVQIRKLFKFENCLDF
jgi:hypothetical protein